jgi:hypothetical protein
VLGASFLVSATGCDRIDVSGPMFASTISLTASGTITVPAGAATSFITVRGTPYTEGFSRDSVAVLLLRAVGMQVDRVGLPAEAPANSSVKYRLVITAGTTCGTSWTGPLNVPTASNVTIFPSAQMDPQDPASVTVTMPSYVYSKPIQFRTQCRGEDGSVAADSVGIVSAMPLLTAIDSIVPRTIPTATPETFRVYAHGCPFVSAVGSVRGASDALDGTLFFPDGSGRGVARNFTDAEYIRTTFESCNTTTFSFALVGARSGDPFTFFVRNPGQQSVAIPMTIR